MSDLSLSFKLLLLAHGYETKEPANPRVPFPSILQELLDYVNSPKYAELEFKERLEYLTKLKANP